MLSRYCFIWSPSFASPPASCRLLSFYTNGLGPDRHRTPPPQESRGKLSTAAQQNGPGDEPGPSSWPSIDLRAAAGAPLSSHATSARSAPAGTRARSAVVPPPVLLESRTAARRGALASNHAPRATRMAPRDAPRSPADRL